MNIYVWLLATICLSRTEAQNCKFPCDMRGKTFLQYDPALTSANWTFTADGISSKLEIDESVWPLDCFAINGSFIIMRERNRFYCFVIRIFDADTFTAYIAGVFGTRSDICYICAGGTILLRFTAGGGLPSAPEPVCASGLGCNYSNMCADNGRLDIGTCDESNTSPSTSLKPTTMSSTDVPPTTRTSTSLQPTNMSSTAVPLTTRTPRHSKCYRRYKKGYHDRRRSYYRSYRLQ